MLCDFWLSSPKERETLLPGNLQLPMVSFSVLSSSSPFSRPGWAGLRAGSAPGTSVTPGPYSLHHHLGHVPPTPRGVWGKEDKEEDARTKGKLSPTSQCLSGGVTPPLLLQSSGPLSRGEANAGGPCDAGWTPALLCRPPDSRLRLGAAQVGHLIQEVLVHNLWHSPG